MTFEEWLRTLPDEYPAEGYICGLLRMAWNAALSENGHESLTNPHNPDNSVSNESETVEKK